MFFFIDLNLVDWSKNNMLAVALGASVYLWNASSGSITQLTELEGNDYVSSLSWIMEGDTLAIGTSLGSVQVLSFLLIAGQKIRTALIPGSNLLNFTN